ncbi:ribonuclease E/G [uncultured Cellulomonas sp.]|uniref:ribonuclease E/G n=1 Tax=uncultured Cellulomonas sp. TaxID=189682 RepID=UPI002629C86F|nr:ribonuclease E/G [uncultured Cellulomonas sp.]
MTSDSSSTPTSGSTDQADPSAGQPAATKPVRRRATRKAAAPVTPDAAAPEPTSDPARAAAEPAPADETPAPPKRTRSRRATSATAAPAAPENAAADSSEPAAEPAPAPAAKRPSRARAKKAAVVEPPAEPATEPADEQASPAGTADDAAPQSPAAAPVLDVLAAFAADRAAAPSTPVAQVQPVADAAGTTEVAEDDADAEEQHAEATGSTDTPTDSASDAPPVLATTALLFQPPAPAPTTKPRRRRAVAQAGPPEFIVPQTVSGADDAAPSAGPATEPAAHPAAAQPTSEPAAEAPAPSDEPTTGRRRGGRRATRSTAAPVADDTTPTSTTPTSTTPTSSASDGSAEPAAADAATVADEPTESPAPRRGSRRRGSRAAAAAAEPTTDGTADDEQPQGADDAPAQDRDRPASSRGSDRAGDDAHAGSDHETDDDSDDERDDDATSEGGPRRRRRRGGRGRRSRSGGDSEERRGTSDDSRSDDDGDDEDEDATDSATDTDRADSSDGADAASGDQDGTAGDSDDEGSGSSRRRRRRRRGGRGGDGAEAESEPTPARARTPRAPSDEVTALRGSTRLEAKRQRRREGRDNGRRRQIITESEFLARRESVDRTMVVREHDGRTQIAVLEDGVLVEHYVSRQAQVSMAGNVYLGRVQNVLPSMEAAFVDVGKGRNAVLYAGEVNWDAVGLEGQPRRIEQALKSGDSVLVQVTKDPIGHKGARLTSQITLAGRYLVYVPGGGMTGISRKLPDNERARLKKLLREIVPDTAGVIVRTAAEGASEEELRADISRLQEQWAAIEKKAKTASAPALLQGEPDLAIRVVRDIFNDDFGSLVVQGDEAWQTISGYIGALAPDLADKVTRWTAEGDVFTAHRVDEQLAKGMDRKVWLPSGGSLVIDRTEAMTVVDVNTGKFTGSGGTLEETVTRNNLEAAEEIVRQLRLRDIGGIIVIDFIDMVLELNRDLVLRRLVECLGRDRTKHQVAEVTSLGLVQMTRKRVGQGLVEAFSETCEHCNGRGFIVHSDPIERAPGQAQPAQTQTPQPPVGGEDPKRARRKRGGTKEQGPAVPSGLPMVPVLPEAREAVKATLATIAAAAAHAHEHESAHGGATDGASDAPVPTAEQRAAATAAVNEALAALQGLHPSADGGPQVPDDASGQLASTPAGEVATPDSSTQAAPDSPVEAASDAQRDGGSDAAPSVDPGDRPDPAVDDPAVDDPAEPADLTEAVADQDETLDLVPVAPEVFELPEQDGQDGQDGHDGEDGQDGQDVAAGTAGP